jgi:DNA-binding PadR family transcriptional regulator
MEQRIVEDAAARKGSKEDPRRKYYRLTKFGRSVLSAEVLRLEAVVREARSHLGMPAPKRV